MIQDLISMLDKCMRPTIAQRLYPLGLLLSYTWVSPRTRSHIWCLQAFLLRVWDHSLERMQDYFPVPNQVLESLKIMDSLREHPLGSSHIPSRPVGFHNRCQAEERGNASGTQNSIVHQEGNHVLVQLRSHNCIHKQPKGNEECSSTCRNDGNNEMDKEDSPFPKGDAYKGES
ncbi:hypothetical protein KIL84_013517 [Mauremys mutica]|uniref:Uncharacterized protein n=1 Tax=Mauremys mutica TaxID=74926 RepID=A0A9D4AN91_9SAUR|nr:hypothetical protein KIL84_013517 [Mauremys mutica]